MWGRRRVWRTQTGGPSALLSPQRRVALRLFLSHVAGSASASTLPLQSRESASERLANPNCHLPASREE
ncbi:unnamed protein product [Arctogadus glacialis]